MKGWNQKKNENGTTENAKKRHDKIKWNEMK